MASVLKRGSKWQARVHRNGVSTAKTFTLKADALRWGREQDLIAENATLRRAEEHKTDSLKLLDELLARYKAEVTPTKRGAKAEAYKIEVLRRHKISQLAAHEIKPSTVAKYRDERLKVVANNTVKNEINLLSAVFEHARTEWDLDAPNPTKGLRRPSDNSAPKRIPTAAELKALLHEVRASKSEALYPVVTLALETGARLGELLSITSDNINLQARTIRVVATKNGHPRALPITVAAHEALSDCKVAGGGRLFGCSADSIKHAFKAAARRSGLGWMSFHTLRHHAVTRLVESGLSLTEVSQISGHRTMQMLARYSHHEGGALLEKLECSMTEGQSLTRYLEAKSLDDSNPKCSITPS